MTALLFVTTVLAARPIRLDSAPEGWRGYVPSWVRGAPMRYKDEFVRVSHGAKQAAKERRRKLEASRKLMTTEPGPSGGQNWLVNGIEIDYAPLNCPASWVDLLDADPNYGACLPYQQLINPSVDSTFKTADGVNMSCTYEDYAGGELEKLYGCASPDPFGSGPMCETFVEGCKYSNNDLRYHEGFAVEKYPRATDGECGLGDATTQWVDCAIPCPAPYPMDQGTLTATFGIPVIAFIVLCTILGIIALKYVGGDYKNYFVAGRTLNLGVCTATFCGQGIDASGTLGALDLAYNFHFWDGFCIPVGIALSLILVGLVTAEKINGMKVLTLPDVYQVKFGRATGLTFAIYGIASFICLFASNLVGFGKIIRHIFGLDSPYAGIAIAGVTVWMYTVAGGILSVAYTDIFQGLFGLMGMLIATLYVYASFPSAMGVSPGYPLGDLRAVGEGMFNMDAYDPIPNAIFFNWVTIIVLGFGNICAIDFQARVMAAKTGKTAKYSCLIAAGVVMIIGGFFNANGGAIRAFYGPASPHAEFVADSCSKDITVVGCFDGAECEALPLVGVPTCGEWKPDPFAPLKFLTCFDDACHYFLDFDGSGGLGAGVEAFYPMPAFLGAWVLVAIVAASMSTGDGSILAMGTCFAHNILRPLKPFTNEKLLLYTRFSTVLWTVLSMALAFALPEQTSTLVIIAFDIMLAGSVVVLMAALYFRDADGNPLTKPKAAFWALNMGSFSRVIFQVALPHDYMYLIGGTYAKAFGPGIYDLDRLGTFLDPALTYEQREAACPQKSYFDMSGVDSLLAPVVSFFTLIIVQKIVKEDYNSATGYWFKPVPVEEEKTTATSKTVESATA